MILTLYETEAKPRRNYKQTKIGGGEKERRCLLFSYALLETGLSGSVYKALNGRMFSECCIRKDVKGSGRGPFQGTVVRRSSIKPTKYRCQAAIRLGHLLSTSWKHWTLNHLAQNIIISSIYIIIFNVTFIYYIITYIPYF
jgi:hypothetical protein